MNSFNRLPLFYFNSSNDLKIKTIDFSNIVLEHSYQNQSKKLGTHFIVLENPSYNIQISNLYIFNNSGGNRFT